MAKPCKTVLSFFSQLILTPQILKRVDWFYYQSCLGSLGAFNEFLKPNYKLRELAWIPWVAQNESTYWQLPEFDQETLGSADTKRLALPLCQSKKPNYKLRELAWIPWVAQNESTYWQLPEFDQETLWAADTKRLALPLCQSKRNLLIRRQGTSLSMSLRPEE